MSNKKFTLAFGKQAMEVSLPAERIIHEIEGRPATAVTDVAAAVREALRNPVDSAPLNQVAQKGDKVAIIVSDITRAWIGSDKFLPVMLDELNSAGVPDEDICIVIALGGHRVHTAEEDIVVCGQEVCRRVKIHQHDAFNKEQLAYVGTTSRGVVAYVNKHVAEADKVILTGGIVYHLMAGFGGGRKSIMPGVSGYTSIQENHRLCMNKEIGKGLNPHCSSGAMLGNEMYEDMLEVTAFVKPAFLLNAVFTPEGEYAQFVAGHWKTAWEKGCKLVEEIYGIPITEKADVVITSAGGFPKDINLYQGSKTIDNGYMAVKEGGVLVCLLECPDIQEPPEFSSWFRPDLYEFEMALRDNFTVPGYVAFKCSDIARQVSLIIVTKPENIDFVNRTGMIGMATVEEALKFAKQKLGREDYTITVMGHGANTVPVLK